MKVYYSDHFEFPLPNGHRFPMTKYTLLRQRILDSGWLAAESFRVPEPASDEQLALVHKADYLERFTQGRLTDKEIRRIGFPWSPQLVERSRRSVGGTIAACHSALQDGVSANLAGGTHHAYPDHGEGFCVFNDTAVAARAMLVEGRARRVVIIDCDVHQGNGTAAAFAHDASVYTFSIHAAKNFPFHKEPSDMDIGLPDGSGDNEFLEALRQAVPEALQKSQADLAIYIAGADPYEGDTLGRLALTMSGLQQRDLLVLRHCYAAGIPVAIVLGGGYAKNADDSVKIHLHTLQIAIQMAPQFSNTVAI